MKSKKRQRQGAEATREAKRPSSPDMTRAVRLPRTAGIVWLGLMAVSVVLTGCARFSWLYVVYLGVSLGILAGELAFLNALYRRGRTGLYLPWKKFTGYSLPVYYFAHALPRVEWANAELIGPGRVVFLFSLALLTTAAGILTFFLAGRPGALAAMGVIKPQEAEDRALRKKRARERRPRGAVAWILDWIDAIAWAAIAVLLVQTFVFQLYEVPTESMVPAFLAGDRPFAFKATYGPRIPLTEWRLPFLRLPRRGDVITLANPRYPENNRVDMKKYVSQIVYMVTLTAVKMDSTLPDGTQKADPLVKRIVGLPGEKLMMVDDVLFTRTSSRSEFQRVQEPWAAVDLWKETPEKRSRIQYLPINKETRELLSKWDARKNSADPLELSRTLDSAYSRIETSLGRLTPAKFAAFQSSEVSRADSALLSRRDEAIRAAGAGENPYSAQGAFADDFSLALAAAASRDARGALDRYVQGARKASSLSPSNAYEKGSRALNLLIKVNLLERVDRDLALMAQGAHLEAFGSDPERTRLFMEAQELNLYILGFYDSRNFPEFPGGGKFLARDEYFAMGDNRYNSLDFRFSETRSIRALDPGDPDSVVYSSMLHPFPLNLKFIEGHALFRLWPLSRLGLIH